VPQRAQWNPACLAPAPMEACARACAALARSHAREASASRVYAANIHSSLCAGSHAKLRALALSPACAPRQSPFSCDTGFSRLAFNLSRATVLGYMLHTASRLRQSALTRLQTRFSSIFPLQSDVESLLVCILISYGIPTLPASGRAACRDCTPQIGMKVESLKSLEERLKEIRLYLDHVCAERLPLNHEIIGHLQACSYRLLASSHQRGRCLPPAPRVQHTSSGP